MATQGKFNGTLLGAYKDGTLMTYSTNFTLNVDNDMFEVTNKDSGGWREIMAGARSWSITGDAFLAFDAAMTMDDLFTEMNARTSFNVRFSTEVSGDIYWHGSCYVSNISVNAPMEDGVTYSFTLEGTAALTQTTRT